MRRFARKNETLHNAKSMLLYIKKVMDGKNPVLYYMLSSLSGS